MTIAASRWSAATDWPEPSFAIFTDIRSSEVDTAHEHIAAADESSKRINHIRSQGKVSLQAARRAEATIRRLTARLPSAPTPTIDGLEDEVSVFWKAGSRTFELSIPDDGEIFVRMTDADGVKMFEEFLDAVPMKAARRQLRLLTAKA